MQSALTSVIDQLILECNDERARLKEKKRKLEGIRNSFASGQPIAAESSRHDSVTSSDEPPANPAKKSKKSKGENSEALATAVADGKKKKEKKDPNKPKKAPSAYNLFFLEYSKKYKADHPDIKQTEIMGVVGPVWKEMDADMKAPYEARAAVLKEQAGEAMAAYTGVPVAAVPASSKPAKAPVVVATPKKVQVKATPTPAPAPERKDSVSSDSSSSSSSSSDSSPEPTPVPSAKKSSKKSKE
jgi:hypothetical protein